MDLNPGPFSTTTFLTRNSARFAGFVFASLWMYTMNRLLYFPARRRAVAGALLAWLCSPAAWAQIVRPMPGNAQRGLLEVTQPPNILINGQAQRLAPGARIRGANNLLVLSGSLVGQPAVLVRYTLDNLGQVHEVWVLTPDEARLERPSDAPISNIRFQSDAATQ
jgi:hypothetical protein